MCREMNETLYAYGAYWMSHAASLLTLHYQADGRMGRGWPCYWPLLLDFRGWWRHRRLRNTLFGGALCRWAERGMFEAITITEPSFLILIQSGNVLGIHSMGTVDGVSWFMEGWLRPFWSVPHRVLSEWSGVSYWDGFLPNRIGRMMNRGWTSLKVGAKTNLQHVATFGSISA